MVPANENAAELFMEGPLEGSCPRCPNAKSCPAQDTCRRRISWSWADFNTLSASELYELLKLRQNVFIVEQGVAYPDIDDRDRVCRHLIVRHGERTVGALRVVPKDVFSPGCFSFGRLAVAAAYRGRGIARRLVSEALIYLDEMSPGVPVKISSQLYLKNFYSQFQFAAQGQPYIEDQIPHIAMIRERGSAR